MRPILNALVIGSIVLAAAAIAATPAHAFPVPLIPGSTTDKATSREPLTANDMKTLAPIALGGLVVLLGTGALLKKDSSPDL